MRSLLRAVVLCLVLTAIAAQAAPTPPGTVISSTAQVDFVLGGAALSEWSNTDSFVVAAMGGGPVDLRLTKRSSRIVAGIGEAVQFTLRVENTGANAADVLIHDRLPGEFRFRASVPANATLAEFMPATSADGRLLIFDIGALAPNQVVEFAYVVLIVSGSDGGFATSTAQAFELTTGRLSNLASATVLIRQDLFAEASFIAGSVLSGGCGGAEAKGVAGVRLYLEDGTVAVTDPRGRYHLEGLQPGLHVVQLDRASVPAGLEPVLCHANTRNGGAADAQFVDTQAGTLWRVDFILRGRPQPATAPQAPRPPQSAPAMTQEALKAWTETAPPRFDIVSPAPGFYPRIGSIDVIVSHPADERVDLTLNGAAVSRNNFDGSVVSASGKWAASRWRGVDIRDGDNILRASPVSASGLRGTPTDRLIHFPGAPVDAEIDAGQSNLVADGATAPTVAIRLTAAGGHPAREGAFVDIGVGAPHRLSGLPATPAHVLSQPPAARSRFMIGAGGIVLVPLSPTLQSGEVTLRVKIADREKVLTTGLSAHLAEPMLTGLAEGTLGHNWRSGEAAEGGPLNAREHLYADGRIAFFFKSTILGDWLLKAGYDSERHPKEQDRKLFRDIEPARYFPVYGDAGTTEHEAQTSGPLFLRLERGRFHAQFGDFDTALSAAHLTRYQRRLSGFQSAYRGENFGYSAFASSTSNRFAKDEIRGNGTSGLYRLSSHPILINSERIAIETRDRFRNGEIVSARALVRHLDYEIDYELGTMFFKEPVLSQDQNLNPLVIVAEYETPGEGDRRLTYGGRAAAFMAGDRVEIGVTGVRESANGRDGALYGLDATLRLRPGTVVSAELAGTKDGPRGSGAGGAYRVELTQDGETFSGRLYAREQDGSFGLEQLNQGLGGSREFGAEARVRLDSYVAGMGLEAKAYRRESERIAGNRDFAELLANWSWADVALQAGMRHVKDSDVAGPGDGTSDQIVLRGSYAMFEDRLTVRATREQSLPGRNANPDFPSRTVLGADYRVSDTLSVLAAQEFVDGPDDSGSLTRIGLAGAPWSGARLSTSAEQHLVDGAGRVFANMGLSQTWQVSERWSLSVALDRQQRVFGEGEDNGGVFDGAGLQSESFTAVSFGSALETEAGTVTGRAEARFGSDERWNVVVGHYLAPYDNLSFANRLRFLHEAPDAGTEATTAALQLGLAYRPADGPLILSRLDIGFERDPLAEAESGTAHGTWKIVNNTIVNLAPRPDLQVSLQLGLKYAVDVFDARLFHSFSALTGAEARYDLSDRFDLGLRAAASLRLPAGALPYALGPSLGYSISETTWLSAGCNLIGFEDEDFSAAGYTAAGPFVQFRMRLDPSDAAQLARWLASD